VQQPHHKLHHVLGRLAAVLASGDGDTCVQSLIERNNPLP